MVNRAGYILLVLALAGTMASCDNASDQPRGAIVLGDSSAIVTETDEQQLKDLVADLQPVIPPAENKDEDPTTPTPDTTAAGVSLKPAPAGKPQAATPPAPEQKTPPPAANTPGLKAEFKEVTVQIPGIDVKQGGRNTDLQRANGAVYSLKGGDINGATLRVSGNVTKVSMRYQTVAVLKSDVGDLPLEALSVTTKWEPMKGGNNTYRITDLDPKSLEFYDADASDIRNAVQRAAQRRRLSRRKVQDLVSSVRHTRNANQKPLTIKLRSVMWKIDGKDIGGRMYSKQVRIDVPL